MTTKDSKDYLASLAATALSSSIKRAKMDDDDGAAQLHAMMNGTPLENTKQREQTSIESSPRGN
jgi:hypothetical protein